MQVVHLYNLPIPFTVPVHQSYIHKLKAFQILCLSGIYRGVLKVQKKSLTLEKKSPDYNITHNNLQLIEKYF